MTRGGEQKRAPTPCWPSSRHVALITPAAAVFAAGASLVFVRGFGFSFELDFSLGLSSDSGSGFGFGCDSGVDLGFGFDRFWLWRQLGF